MSEEPSLLSTRFWQSIEAVEKYAKRRYRKWDQRMVAWREHRLVTLLLDKYAIFPGTILDIPAGYGRFTEFFLERDMDIFSADLSLYAMMYLRDRFLEVSKTTVASVWDIPFKDDQFDLVFSFRLLDLFPDREKRISALREISRVSRKWVLLSVYLSTPLHFMARLPSRTKRVMLRKKEVMSEFQEANLNLIECRKIFPGLHAQTVCLLKI